MMPGKAPAAKAALSYVSLDPATAALRKRLLRGQDMLNPVESNPQVTSAHGTLDFLSNLAQDSSVLSDLKRDPVGALASHGIYLDSKALPAEISLPDADYLKSMVRQCNSEASLVKNFMGFFGELSGD
jgi:hypothetical protein